MTIDDFIYENSIVRDNGSEYTADHIDRVIESVCNNYGLTIKMISIRLGGRCFLFLLTFSFHHVIMQSKLDISIYISMAHSQSEVYRYSIISPGSPHNLI